WPVRAEAEPPLRPLRLFAQPEPVEVLADFPHGPPAAFRWRRAFHRLALIEGPERIAMEWWRLGDRDDLTRDYFRAEDFDGARFWLYREGVHRREVVSFRWFLHGLFA
ncbi:MAG: DNA polymerase Y family protein, partial [Xanthobacteraceae bacterium]